MEKRVDAGYDADHTAVCWGGLCSRYARSWPLLECFSGRAWRAALEIWSIPGVTCSPCSQLNSSSFGRTTAKVAIGLCFNVGG